MNTKLNGCFEQEKIAIWANHGMFGGAANLESAFNEIEGKYDVELYCHADAPYHQQNGCILRNVPKNNWKQVVKFVENCDKFFIIDYQGLEAIGDYLSRQTGVRITHKFDDRRGIQAILNFLSSKKCIFFWTGSRYKKHHSKVNEWVKLLGVKRTYAMPDLMYCDKNALPLYQTFDLPLQSEKPKGTFTIMHSPGKKLKGDLKGTQKVIQAVEVVKRNGYDVDLKIIKNMDYFDCINYKRKYCHLFVDQITKDFGGIGKSGLESIEMGIPTASDVDRCNFGERYSDIPVLNTPNVMELGKLIQDMIDDESFHNAIRDQTIQYSKLRPIATVEYLSDTMRW